MELNNGFKGKTLRIEDAGRFITQRPFSLMLKPVGSRCNLNCSYCYYLKQSPASEIMDINILKRAIEETILANDTPEISFCWHGGEPLMAGIDFFIKAVEFQNKAVERKVQNGFRKPLIINTIQTNGTLIDKDWCNFFRESNFLVGISIDGPEDIHNYFRVNRTGDKLYEKAINGLELLRDNNVEFNVLCTVNSRSKGRGREVYKFLKSKGVKFMQFLPVVDPGKEWGTEAEDYGNFMKDVFREWWENEDAGSYYVQLFDVVLANFLNVPCGLCQFSPVCGDVPVLESNGDIFCCDHFVNSLNYLGNLNEISLAQAVFSKRIAAFGADKSATLPLKCTVCKFKTLCNGGCPEHRVLKQSQDFYLNYLCKGYMMFFEFALPYFKQMADQICSERE
ncbi:MAG: anaerobic sulfatase maturase [Bacteroidetes bacterium HGW-Bacteroidetes-7]|jgi:uncharacterized protein|nr:MAG: anaerobic sulfatase maturase [Bacteroidetes bacterium HGW-Bacteroidetes-7]